MVPLEPTETVEAPEVLAALISLAGQWQIVSGSPSESLADFIAGYEAVFSALLEATESVLNEHAGELDYEDLLPEPATVQGKASSLRSVK
jgi:hypothetical protein